MIPMWYIPNTTSGKHWNLAVPARPFFDFCEYGAPQFICFSGFSHLSKVRLERFSVVAFSGSHTQIFLPRLFAHLLKIHPVK